MWYIYFLMQDGTICLWNLSGKLLQCVSCKRALGHRKLQGQGSTNGEGGPDVKGHMDGSQESLVEGTESLAIKRMVYDEQLNILAVLFFKYAFFYLLYSRQSKKPLGGRVVSTSNFGSWGLGFESCWMCFIAQSLSLSAYHHLDVT